jgi:pyridoxal phosphate enzyme (YggS family)
MSINIEAYHSLMNFTASSNVLLVAVSKTKPNEDISELYHLGHRDFGENYVQELLKKQAELPQDIRWHFIGHLQTNKVKQIAPFVHLIHGVDSIKLLQEIDKVGAKLQKKISCLLQVHIATEETKFGFDKAEVLDTAKLYFKEGKYPHVQLCGLMGMASFTADEKQVQHEFQLLNSIFNEIKKDKSGDDKNFNILSMGMSNDYKIAVESGSNLIRIGSMLFGSRK